MNRLTACHFLAVVLMVVCVVALGACTAASAPVPTAAPIVETAATLLPPTETSVPTETPIPPTATSVPTNTPVPDPSIKNLKFSINKDMSKAFVSGAGFDVAPGTVYVAFDYVGIPIGMNIEATLQRGDLLLYDKSEKWEGGSSGTMTRTILDDPRLLIPGRYDVTLRLAGQKLQGYFLISATQGKPGAVLIADDFSDSQLGWLLSDNGRTSSAIHTGMLEVDATQANSLAMAGLPNSYQDIDLAVDVRQLTGPKVSYFNIIFRFGPNGGYLFNLFSNGQFNVGIGSMDGLKQLVRLQSSKVIKPFNDFNRLRVVAKGNKFAFYINDTVVATLTDDSYKSGSVLLGGGTTQQGALAIGYDNFVMALPKEDVALMPTKVVPTAPVSTAAPVATAQPAAPPLANSIVKARNQVESIGGAMDRLYNGSGAEACSPLLADYGGVVNAPEYDVSAQPANVQGAYALYRQAVALIADKIKFVSDACTQGGGNVGKLAFDVGRTAIGNAGSMLTNALNQLGQ